MESSRTPSIVNTTHPVMGDSVDVHNLSFSTSLFCMGSICKTHPEQREKKTSLVLNWNLQIPHFAREQSWLILTCPAHSQSPIGQLSGSLQAHSKQSYVIIIKEADVFLPVLNFPGHIEPKFGFSSTHCQDPPFLGSTKRKCPSVHSIRHPSTSSPRVLSQKKPYSCSNCYFLPLPNVLT